jgi:ArsR family transcriptional regulator, lead/cadmium/zinc/bismuth-responsive transcriptional repressor
MKQQRKQEIINSLKMCAELSDGDLENHFENLRQLGKNILENKKLKKLEKFFNLLGNDTRLILLKLLSQKSYCVCELETILDKAQSSISHHLRLLEKAGLIRGIKSGYFTNYEVVETKIEKFLNALYEQYPSLKD